MKKLLFLFTFLIYQSSLNAQWQMVDSITAGAIQCIEFVNSDTGFVYNDWATMRKTSDGVQSWDTCKSAFESYIFDIDFADANVGYAVGGAWFPFAKYYANGIMKTVDGGATWDSIFGNYHGGVFTDVEVLSANEFFAVGEGWACHSSDGGVTLDTMMVSQSINERFLKISFLTTQHGYLLSQIFIQNQGAAYQLYETVDRGNTWQMMYSDTVSNSGFSDFIFNSSGDGMIVGEKGQVRINKGSNSWTAVALPDTALWLHKLDIADGKVYAIGSKVAVARQNRLFSSIDFGMSWQQEPITLDTLDHITDLSFPDGGVGYFTTYKKLYKNSSLISITDNIMQKVGIFPNPSDDFVQLNLPEEFLGDVRIVNSMGQEVASWKSVKNGTQLDVSDIPSGVYFVDVQSDQYSYLRSSMIISH